MAGIDRTTKAYNSAHAKRYGDRNMREETKRTYTEQIDDVLGRTKKGPEDYSALKNFLVASITGESYVDNDGNTHISAIPTIARSRIATVLNGDFMSIMSREHVNDYIINRKSDLFEEYDKKAQNAIALKDSGFFKALTSHAQATTGGRNISIPYENVARGYNISQTSKQSLAALQNLKQNGFVVWDLETTAGNTKMGPVRYSGAITEFAFTAYDNTGQKMKRTINGKQVDATYNAILASTDEDIARYEDILKRLKSGKMMVDGKSVTARFTEEEIVNIERLALTGNAGTIIDKSRENEGIWTFEKFADKKDLALGGYDLVRDVEAGIKIHKDAQALNAIKTTFGINGRSFEVTGAENELLGGLNHILVGSKTAVGYNSRPFDLHRMKQFVASGRVSQGFIGALREMYSVAGIEGDDLTMPNHLDALPLLRKYMDPNEFYTQEDFRAMKPLELHDYSQEAIVRKITGGSIASKHTFYDNGSAHRAATDIEALAVALKKGGLFGRGMMDKEDLDALVASGGKAVFEDIEDQIRNEALTQSDISRGDVLFAKNFMDPRKVGGLMVFEDPDTGALITHDNFVVSKSGRVLKDKMNIQTGAQRGVLYNVMDIKKLDFGDGDQKTAVIAALEKSNPNLAVDQLYAIELQQFGITGSRLDETSRSRGRFWYVDTIQNLQTNFSNNFFKVGKGVVDANGNTVDIDTTNIGDDIIEQLVPVHQAIDENGIGRLEYGVKDFRTTEGRKEVMDFVKSTSMKRSQEDAAARMSRRASLKKDKKLVALFDALHKRSEEIAKAFPAMGRGATWKQAESEFFRNSVEISKMLLEGKTSKDKKIQALWDISFHGTIGFDFEKEDIETGLRERKTGLYSNTLSSQLIRMKTLMSRDNREYTRQIIAAAESAGNGNEEQANLIYTRIRRNITDYFMADGRRRNAQALGYLPDDYAINYMYTGKYEVNLRGFKNVNVDTPFTIYTNTSSPLSLADRLVSKIHGEKKYMSDQSKAYLLKDLQSFLTKKGNIEFLDNDNELLINSDDSAHGAASKLIHHMNLTREDLGQEFGHLNGTGTLNLSYVWNKTTLPKDKFDELVNEAITTTPQLIRRSFGTNAEENRNLATYLADILTNGKDGLLFKDVDDSVLAQSGWSTKDIGNLKKFREMKRAGAKEYYTAIFSAVGDMGGDIHINQKTGRTLAVFGETAYDIGLISSKFENGQYVDRLGRNAVTLGVGLYRTEDRDLGIKDGIRETSVLQKYMGKLKKDLYYARRDFKEDRPEDHVQAIGRAISTFHQLISSDSPGVKYLGTNSRNEQLMYNYGDVINNLYLLKDKLTEGKKYELKGHKETIGKMWNKISSFVDNKVEFTADDLNMDEVNILMVNYNNIMRAVKETFGGDIANYVLKDFSPNNKFAYEFKGSVKEGGINLLTEYVSEKRKQDRFADTRINGKSDAIHEILQLANSDDPTKTLFIKEMGTFRRKDVEALRGIRLHGAMMKKDYAGTLQTDPRIMKHGFREVRMNVLHTDTDLLNQRVNEALVDMLNDKSKRFDKDITHADIDLVSNMFLKEGHAYMHGQVFDTFFNASESMQMIKYDGDKVLDAVGDELLDIKQRGLATPEVIISKDGKLSFKYGKGSMVERDHDVLSFRSQGKVMSRPAKTSGLLKFGFFDNNKNLVSEDKITDILESEGILQSLANISDEYERQAFIHDALEQNGLSSAYYILSEKANPYRKLTELKEKNMTVGMIDKTGSIDKRVDKVLTSLGFKNYGTKFSLEENNLLNIDLVNSMHKLDEGDFWTVAAYRYNKLTGKQLDKGKMSQILSDAGFASSNGLLGSMQDFHDAIMEERYRASDFAEALFRQIGYLKDGEHFHLITDHSEDIRKHKDLVALESMVTNLLEKNIEKSKTKFRDEDKAIEEALRDTAVQFTNLIAPREKANSIFDIDIENRSLLIKKELGEITLPDEDAFNKLIGQKDAFRRAQDTAELVVATIRQIDFHDQEKFGDNAARPNQRTIANLSQIRYSEKGLAESKAFLEHSGHGELFEKYFGNVKDGQIVGSGAVHQLESRMFERGGRDVAGFLTKDAKGNFIWGIDDTVLEDIIKKNNIFDGDIDKGKKLLHALIQGQREIKDINNFSEKGVLNLYEGYMNAIAAAYNRGQVSDDFVDKMGFRRINIKDLIVDNDNRIDESMFGRNILIDLKDDYYGMGDQMYKSLKGNEKSARTALAVAYTPTDKYKEGAQYAKQPQVIIKQLKRRLQNYREGMGLEAGAEIANIEERERRKKRVIDALNELDIAQYNQFNAKNGVMNEVLRSSISDASYNTASGIDLMQLNKDTKGKVLIRNFDDLVADGTNEHSLSKLTMKLGGKNINLMEESSKLDKAMQLNYTLISTEKMNDIYKAKYTKLRQQMVESGMTDAEAGNITDKVLKDTMEKVSTEGTTGLNYKEPTQYHGSVIGTRIYASDVVKGNQVITNFTRDEMGKIDFDSDKMFSGLHVEDAQVRVGDKTFKMKVDSAMYDVLRSNGLEVTFLSKGAEKRFLDYEAAQVYIATDTAQRYRRLIEGSQKTYNFSSFSTEYLVDENEKKLRGGRVFYNTKDLVREEDAHELWHEYITQIETQRRDNKIYNIAEQRLAALERLDNLAHSKYGVRQVEEVTEKMDASLYKQFRALKFGQALEMVEADMLSTTGQPLGAGMANSYTQTITNITQRFLDENADFVNEYYKKRGSKLTAGAMSSRTPLVTMALQEMFLSPKNEKGVIYFDEGRVNKMREAFKDWLSLSDNPSQSKMERAYKNLSDLFYETLASRPDKEILKDPMLPSRLELKKKGITDVKKYWKDMLTSTNPETHENDFLRQVANEQADLMVNVMSARADFRKMAQGPGATSAVKTIDYLPDSLGASLEGEHNVAGRVIEGYKRTAALFLGNDDAAAAEAQNLVLNLGGVTSRGSVDETISRAKNIENDLAARNRDMLEAQLARATRGMAAGMEGISGSFKKAGLLGAAIGLAGGLILSGFAHDPKAPPPPEMPPQQHIDPNQIPPAPLDGAPPPASSAPQPNNMLAAGADAQATSAMPIQQNNISLSDPTLDYMMGNRRKSYTITVSGKTGKNRGQVIQAMDAALYHSGVSMGNGNGRNFSVSINNNYKDTLSQKDVNRMVSDAMIA